MNPNCARELRTIFPDNCQSSLLSQTSGGAGDASPTNIESRAELREKPVAKMAWQYFVHGDINYSWYNYARKCKNNFL